MPAFPQAPYSQEFLDECKTLSDNNKNSFRLMSLKKDKLKQICVHYNIDINGIKDKLVEKIVNHRDTLFECPSQYHINEIEKYLRVFLKYIKESRTMPCYGRWSFLSLSKTKACDVVRVDTTVTNSNHTVIINFPYTNNILKNIPKINLVVYLRRIKQLIKNKPSILPSEINRTYEQYSKEQLIEKIKISLLKLEEIQKVLPKEIKVVNKSGISLEIFKVIIRQDNSDYSECTRINSLDTNMQLKVLYTDDNTNIIAVKQRQDGFTHYHRCYLLDIKDYIVMNKKVTEGDLYNRLVINNTIFDELNRWKKAALKCDFLLKELKRLGCEEHDTYGCILDLHQDISIPNHTERDKDIAGIPSAYTNIT